MDERWTLSELVSEVAARIAALPAPANGQVRAVPDERTVRYYGTIGLLDRPVAPMDVEPATEATEPPTAAVGERAGG